MHLYAFSSLTCYVTPSLVALAHLLLVFLTCPIFHIVYFFYSALLYNSIFTMEILLPVKAPVSSSRTASYRLETRNLSYNLCSEFDQLTNWIFCGWSPGRARKSILKNVNCEARPGEITAVAGPSGAGKTTLLEILAGKISPIPEVSNQVLVNNQPMDAKLLRKLSGFVSQDDALFALLTVQETLLYSALLRLPVGKKEAVNRVRRLMNDLGLDHIADSRIGDGSSSGISGGERRRVSIGVELVHDPAVVFIDEPTSGLDSASALHVVTLLKSMVDNQGKTIVITIHQPGFRILEMIDRVVLLSNGSVVHNGSLDCVEDRLKLAGHRIPLHVNVLEFAIDIIETLGQQQNSESPNNPSREIRNNEHLATRNPEKICCYANSVLEEVSILGRRFCSNIFRTKQLFATRIIQASVVGFLLGSIFFKVGTETGQAALQARIGFFAFSLTFLLSSTTEGLPIFLQERRILMRETSRGAYRVSSYVLSNTLIFLPFLLMVGLLFSTPVYWLVGLRRDVDGFLYFSLVVWMVVSMANSFVACFSALVPNFIMGNSVIAGMMGSFFLFSGYFLTKKDIPNYWIFMHYLSLFKYPFECFLINEYGGAKGNRICLEYGEGECSLDGSGFLRQQELAESLKWSNLAIMLGFIVGYRVLSFLILWLRCYKSR